MSASFSPAPLWPDDLLNAFADPDELRERLDAYLHLLLEWNQRINLISRKETAPEIHFIDSLHFAWALPAGGTVGDIGSGAGFPGLVTALARPDLHVTLVEPNAKKQAFLEAVCQHFGLAGVTRLRARLERGRLVDAATSRARRISWDHAVCKALADPERFIEMANGCASNLWFLASRDQATAAAPDWREHHAWTVAGGRERVLLQLQNGM